MSSLSQIPYTIKSLSGIITLADGAGSIISGGRIETINANITNASIPTLQTLNQNISGNLIITGNTPCVSVGTGTLIVNGGGISTTGNIHLGKDLVLLNNFKVGTSNIQFVDTINLLKLEKNTLNDSPIKLLQLRSE